MFNLSVLSEGVLQLKWVVTQSVCFISSSPMNHVLWNESSAQLARFLPCICIPLNGLAVEMSPHTCSWFKSNAHKRPEEDKQAWKTGMKHMGVEERKLGWFHLLQHTNNYLNRGPQRRNAALCGDILYINASKYEWLTWIIKTDEEKAVNTFCNLKCRLFSGIDTRTITQHTTENGWRTGTYCT